MKNDKTIISFLFLILSFISMVAALISLTNSYSNKLEFLETEKPVRTVEKIAVDSEGLIYYHIPSFRSLQVYNNSGDFLYRIAFPGDFHWTIDSEDLLHVVMRRNDRLSYHTIIARKAVLEEAVIDATDSENNMIIYDNNKKTNYKDQIGYQYSIKEKVVQVLDQNGDFVARIAPKGPIFPLSVGVFYFFFVVGIAGTILINPDTRKIYHDLMFKNRLK